ncbi:MAG: hypothetical protein JXQ96_23325 [Cyclobacteriaceae bacterium]
MGRPRKKVVELQGDEITKQEPTKVKEVKIKKTIVEDMPLKKDGSFLASVNGADSYWTRSQLNIMFQRNSHSVKIPKGSEYTAPLNSECKDCG